MFTFERAYVRISLQSSAARDRGLRGVPGPGRETVHWKVDTLDVLEKSDSVARSISTALELFCDLHRYMYFLYLCHDKYWQCTGSCTDSSWSLHDHMGQAQGDEHAESVEGVLDRLRGAIQQPLSCPRYRNLISEDCRRPAERWWQHQRPHCQWQQMSGLC